MHARLLLISTLFLAALGMPGMVKAEGRCPPGQYPIGSPNGVMGCAPIPGSEQPSAELSSSTYNRPPKIVTEWGAVARSPSGREIGWSPVRQHKQKSAEKLALRACKEKSGQACQIVASYSGQCVLAMQHTDTGQFEVILESPDTYEPDMHRAAQQRCPGGRCRAAWSHCASTFDRNATYPSYGYGVYAAPLPFW